jgi:hypothetical protein
MLRGSGRTSNIEALKGQLFDHIVMHFGKDNGVPMMVAGGGAVIEEIELAVERLLLCPSVASAALSTEINAMAEMWRSLDRMTRSERYPARNAPSMPYAMPMAV